jgi:hypothetical protein
MDKEILISCIKCREWWGENVLDMFFSDLNQEIDGVKLYCPYCSKTKINPKYKEGDMKDD